MNVVTAEIVSDGGTDTNYQPVNPAMSEKKEKTFKEAEIAIPQTPTQSRLGAVGQGTGSRGFLQASSHDKIAVRQVVDDCTNSYCA